MHRGRWKEQLIHSANGFIGSESTEATVRWREKTACFDGHEPWPVKATPSLRVNLLFLLARSRFTRPFIEVIKDFQWHHKLADFFLFLLARELELLISSSKLTHQSGIQGRSRCSACRRWQRVRLWKNSSASWEAAWKRAPPRKRPACWSIKRTKSSSWPCCKKLTGKRSLT